MQTTYPLAIVQRQGSVKLYYFYKIILYLIQVGQPQ